MKKPFLVAHDYGMGGIWMFIRARTADEIRTAYPELTVFEKPPTFLSEAEITKIRKEPAFDIDQSPTDYLATLVEKRREK